MPDHAPAPVAVLTGASSGIGLATARLLASSGWRIALVARDPARLEQARATLHNPDTHRIIPSDLALQGAPDHVISTTLSHFKRIDALINNAGLAPLLPIDKHDEALLQRLYTVNAIAPARAIAACWPHFVTRRSGVIVNVSTLGTRDPFPGFFGYASSKAAVNLLAQSAAKEGKPHNIRAFSVAPGAVETPMLRALFDTSAIPSSSCLSPDDVARVIVDCVEGRRDQDNGKVIYLSA